MNERNLQWIETQSEAEIEMTCRYFDLDKVDIILFIELRDSRVELTNSIVNI